MSGFDTGNSQGIGNGGDQAAGPILRGFGPPQPAAGVKGALYIDVLTWQLFEKRMFDSPDPWGHYLFVVPTTYRNTLRFFGPTAPSDDIGVSGDFYMQWGGFGSYGMSPVIFGPKAASWTGDGPNTTIAVGGGATVIQVGLLAEGTQQTDMQPNQLLAVGLLAEVTVPVPVTANDGDVVSQIGLASGGINVSITPNTRYTAIDQFAVS